MLKSLRFVLLLIIVLTALIPVAAQEYDQDDIDQAVCLHIEINTGPTGQYFTLFFYQDDLNALLNGQVPDDVPTITIEETRPNTVLIYNIIVAPQTLMAVATPLGAFEAIVWKDGQLELYALGSLSWRRGDMAVDCLGAATDGRVNRFDQQMLATIYPDGAGGYDVWAIDPATSEGTFDYNVTRAQVDAGLAAAGASWQTLGSGATSTFYAAADGQCVLNSPNAGGEMQTFVFNCTAE